MCGGEIGDDIGIELEGLLEPGSSEYSTRCHAGECPGVGADLLRSAHYQPDQLQIGMLQNATQSLTADEAGTHV